MLISHVDRLGLRYAAAAFSTDLFGGLNLTRLVSGISCKGITSNYN
jgi:hypothetical protein